MRRFLIISVLLTAMLTLSGCHRRPLVELDNNVILNITIDTSIVNYKVQAPPEMMRAIFFDSRTGDFVSHSFLPHQGGHVQLMPGREYDILVYNFDTEATIINGDHNIREILAYTNLVPENIKSKLKGRAGKSPDEMIVYEPDHLFVGKKEKVYIPQRGEGMPAFQIDIHAETVVQTWIVEIDKVQGYEYVSAASSVISGLADHTLIGQRQQSYDEATVFFEAASLTKDGHFYAKFNTFGRNVLAGRSQILSLVLTDTGGESWCFNMDVSAKFNDNPEQYIYIKTGDIVIEKPEQLGGGGLAPEVEDWGEINTEIII